MSVLLVGYARCSTDQQDPTPTATSCSASASRPTGIYVDHGLTGTNRERPGLREAFATCRAGGTLVVIDETHDLLIRVLKAHPAVEDAFHEDRGVYRIEHRQPISTEEFAELAARALVSHHVHAAAHS